MAIDPRVRDRWKQIESKVKAIGRECARRLRADLDDGEGQAIEEAWRVLKAAPLAKWEHIEKRLRLRLMATRSPLRRAQSSVDGATTVEEAERRDARRAHGQTKPGSAPDSDDVVTGQEDEARERAEAAERVSFRTGVGVGHYVEPDPGEPWWEWRPRRCSWYAQPSCDQRVFDAVVPYLSSRRVKNRDGKWTRDPKAIENDRRIWRKWCHDQNRREQEAGRVPPFSTERIEATAATFGKPRKPGRAEHRGEKIDRLRAAADAIRCVYADPDIVRRIDSRCAAFRDHPETGLNMVEHLSSWEHLLQSEAEDWAREPSPGPVDFPFREMVERLAEIRGLKGRRLTEISITEILFALNVLDRPLSAVKSKVNDALDAIRPRKSPRRAGGNPPRI